MIIASFLERFGINIVALTRMYTAAVKANVAHTIVYWVDCV